MLVKISVRELVEFILRYGDIDNRVGSFSENAMQEGGRIHRMIQKRMGADYRAEVPLSFIFHGKKCDIQVEGRADGIISNSSGVIVDEIKSTYADVMRYREPYLLHLAQVKFYAYIVSREQSLSEIGIRLTYCNIDTEEIRYFNERYTLEELEEFVNEVCSAYEKWAVFANEWHEKRNVSIKKTPFPFHYRDGQDELVKNVYYTIYHKRKLFLEAPTGVGKTISTMYPSVSALGQDMASKIFYLTAKTITRTVALEALDIMRRDGLLIKSVMLTAKEKICRTGETECNPEACPYAKGHYDRVNDAVYALITENDSVTRELILEYSEKYMVCPFEMSLDVSLFCDCIICDYNYAFDPRAKLKRFFAEEKKGDFIFLVDEAHNLVDRAREMYSSSLVKEDFMEIKRLMALDLPSLSKKAEKCNKELLKIRQVCNDAVVEPDIVPFIEALVKFYATLEKLLNEREKKGKKDMPGQQCFGDDLTVIEPENEIITSSQLRKDLLNFYFEISAFLSIYELLDENYRVYAAYDDNNNFFVKLFCINPSKNLSECMINARSTVLFSATLLPIGYYKLLLAGTKDDYEVYAKSVFNPDRLGIFIAKDVTSKYTRRSDSEYLKIAEYIKYTVAARKGNYMVFFPSYGFMDNVTSAFEKVIAKDDGIEYIVQTGSMTEAEREDFLDRFKNRKTVDFADILGYEVEIEEDDEDKDERTAPEENIALKSLVGFCVMGGIFSEGIDLKEDSLIGAVIVGTGLPLVCFERELIKDYFDCTDLGNGFDFAYRYPGMNKVLQAAGRVIRTEKDMGTVVLLDERFLQNSYRKMFPREWKNISTVSGNDIDDKISRFWDRDI